MLVGNENSDTQKYMKRGEEKIEELYGRVKEMGGNIRVLRPSERGREKYRKKKKLQ